VATCVRVRDTEEDTDSAEGLPLSNDWDEEEEPEDSSCVGLWAVGIRQEGMHGRASCPMQMQDAFDALTIVEGCRFS
jgi:hypothetical protein